MDFFGNQPVNHWAGLIDAAGVLVVLGLWLFLNDSYRWARAAVAVAGLGVLVLVAGSTLQGLGQVTTEWVFSDTFEREGNEGALARLGVAAAAFVVAAVAASQGREDHDDEPDDDEEDVAPPPSPLPASVWSRTEVLGEAPERRDDDPEPRPVLERRVPFGVPGRVVAIPLLAVAAGVALPTIQVSAFDRTALTGDLTAWRIALHAGIGMLAGVALLGAVLALDVWERRLVTGAFAVTAAGAGLYGAYLPWLGNEWWVAAATGIAPGLLLPALLRTLRRLPAVPRHALVAGVTAAMVMFGGMTALRATVFEKRYTEERSVVGF